MRERLLLVFAAILLVGGCGGSKPATDTQAAPPTTTAATPPPPSTTTAPQEPPPPSTRPPKLPRMQGEVLAVLRGGREYNKVVTVFLTLDGRELARLRGYSPYGYVAPWFHEESIVAPSKKWTLRDGRVVRATNTNQPAIRVRGFRGGCTALATVPAGTLVSCLSGSGPGSGALLLRRPDGEASVLVNKPPHGMGYWRTAYISPDGTQLLLTWSHECESTTAFLAPAAGGDPIPFTGDADWRTAQESYGLGWTRDGRALVYLTEGICGPSGGPPGVYARAEGGSPKLVAPGLDAAFFRD